MTGKFCDVLGKKHEARTYRITMIDCDSDIGSQTLVDEARDFCPAALDRAMGLIAKACSKPTKRKAGADGR